MKAPKLDQGNQVQIQSSNETVGFIFDINHEKKQFIASHETNELAGVQKGTNTSYKSSIELGVFPQGRRAAGSQNSKSNMSGK